MFDLILETRTRINEAAILDEYGLGRKSYILATIHRPENTDIEENIRGIMFALYYFARKGMKVFFPAHPRTRKVLAKLNLDDRKETKNLIIHDPVSYTEMIALEANASLTITDSGGVQKESYFLHTPCIIPRNEVEWVELVDLGWATLTGKSDLEIIDVAEQKLSTTTTDNWIHVYGDGRAGDRIRDILKVVAEKPRI
jgi:UDP-N-acetylglucosamine 2-epimerase